MTSISKILAAAVVAGLTSAATVATAEATDSLTMKPLHGISFDVGAKRAISYFEADKGACKVTILVAAEFNETVTRHELSVIGGKSAIEPVEGAKLELACHVDAAAMTVTTLIVLTAN